ncbi:unnamed protein product [Prorocentrum cordatum]|uniref:Uncharacterized protein n=2 Tax=Prorocentrum cordatum TaxID=2364126 RepID=A0ABN9SWH7_9DINO|nr:unnamed protein product [Polarella glacialis]
MPDRTQGPDAPEAFRCDLLHDALRPLSEAALERQRSLERAADEASAEWDARLAQLDRDRRRLEQDLRKLDGGPGPRAGPSASAELQDTERRLRAAVRRSEAEADQERAGLLREGAELEGQEEHLARRRDAALTRTRGLFEEVRQMEAGSRQHEDRAEAELEAEAAEAGARLAAVEAEVAGLRSEAAELRESAATLWDAEAQLTSLGEGLRHQLRVRNDKEEALTSPVPSVACPDSAGSFSDACAAMHATKLRRYAAVVPELADEGVEYRPLIWSCWGRPHGDASAAIHSMAAAASRRRGVAALEVLARRAKTLAGIQLWRRAAAMVAACVPTAPAADAAELIPAARERRLGELGMAGAAGAEQEEDADKGERGPDVELAAAEAGVRALDAGPPAAASAAGAAAAAAAGTAARETAAAAAGPAGAKGGRAPDAGPPAAAGAAEARGAGSGQEEDAEEGERGPDVELAAAEAGARALDAGPPAAASAAGAAAAAAAGTAARETAAAAAGPAGAEGGRAPDAGPPAAAGAAEARGAGSGQAAAAAAAAAAAGAAAGGAAAAAGPAGGASAGGPAPARGPAWLFAALQAVYGPGPPGSKSTKCVTVYECGGSRGGSLSGSRPDAAGAEQEEDVEEGERGPDVELAAAEAGARALDAGPPAAASAAGAAAAAAAGTVAREMAAAAAGPAGAEGGRAPDAGPPAAAGAAEARGAGSGQGDLPDLAADLVVPRRGPAVLGSRTLPVAASPRRPDVLCRAFPPGCIWRVTVLTAVIMALLNFVTIMAVHHLVDWKWTQMQDKIRTWGLFAGVCWLTLICTGFATVCTLIVHIVSPSAGGSGAPENKCWLNGTKEIRTMFTGRNLFVRAVAVILSNSTGYPVGREGPTVTMGSNVAFIITRWVFETFGPLRAGQRGIPPRMRTTSNLSIDLDGNDEERDTTSRHTRFSSPWKRRNWRTPSAWLVQWEGLAPWR